jgi:hypothetical protein
VVVPGSGRVPDLEERVELSEERLREALLARLRAERIEPPALGRVERLLGASRTAFEQRLAARTCSRRPAQPCVWLEGLIEEAAAEAGGDGGLAKRRARGYRSTEN